MGKKDEVFKPGDLVIVEQQPSQKMEANFSGTAEIVKVGAHNTIWLKWPSDTEGEPEEVHVQRVKRFNHLRVGTGIKELRWCSTPTHLYVVESVLQHKREKGEVMLLVKWRFWDDSYNSWLQASEYVEANVIVQMYLADKKLKVAPKKKKKKVK